MTRLTHRWAAVLVGCLVTLLGAGCSAGSDAGDNGPAGGGSGQDGVPQEQVGPIPAGLTDPCALLTTAEVAQAAGVAVRDGARQPTVDASYVSCAWFAVDDDLKIAPVVGLDLFPVTDTIKSDVESDLLSGQGEALPGVGDRTEVQAADLNTAGRSYAVGWKGAIYYRLDCNTPLNATVPSKQICIKAVTAAASRLT